MSRWSGDELHGLRFILKLFVKQFADQLPDSNGRIRRWKLQLVG